MLLRNRDPHFDRDGYLVAIVVTAAALALGIMASRAHPAEQDTRPVIYAYTMKGCQPCGWLHRDVDAGKLSQFRVVFRDPPEWVETVPVLHYQGSGGKWKVFRGWRSDGSPEKFAARWEFWNRKGQ